MDKKMLTAEEIQEKAKELGYDLSIEDCEEAADMINEAPAPEDNGDAVELDEAALEDVVGGVSISSIYSWVKRAWKNRPSKSPGKISSWEQGIISAATKKFGWKACAVATGFFLLY